jgi:biopolymer transport protein ExbD
MGAVADVKEALRESGVTKVNYSKAESKTEQSNISVTINSNGDAKSDEVAEVKEALCESGVTKVNYSTTEPKSETKTVKARNILIVNIDTNGAVSVRGKECNNQQLKREVKKFIHNFRLLTLNTRALRVIRISGGRQYDKNSEFTTTAVKMGEGVSMACPVSKGIVSINSELPMKDPTVGSVSNAVYEAFMELREKMAHRIYNKSYDKLDEAQKAEIDKVVPINISLAEKK